MAQPDNFETQQKRQSLIAAVVIGLLLSNVSLALRLWARLRILKRLRKEDWFMIVGLFLSYGTVVCLLYGLSMGLAEPFNSLTQDRRRGVLLSIWVIQKFQPPTLFCVKTSIILFNASIFQTPKFRLVSQIVWCTSLVWMIGTFIGTIVQCSPPSFFWDKSQSGACIPNTLLTIGLTSGIISCVGDVIILLMPLPILVKLNMARRTKIGLMVVFVLGLFVVITSFIRWITLIGAPSDGFNSIHVQVGIWTYLEMSIGITCGNIPFLAPLLGCVGPRHKHTSGSLDRSLQEQAGQKEQAQRKQTLPTTLREADTGGKSAKLGFTGLYDSLESGSHSELEPTVERSNEIGQVGTSNVTEGLVVPPNRAHIRGDMRRNRNDLELGYSDEYP